MSADGVAAASQEQQASNFAVTRGRHLGWQGGAARFHRSENDRQDQDPALMFGRAADRDPQPAARFRPTIYGCPSSILTASALLRVFGRQC